MGKVLKMQHKFLSNNCCFHPDDNKHALRRDSLMVQKRPVFHTLARIAFVALLCLALCGGAAQAYELILKAPSQIQRGMPLVVNGTSNLPPGISVDIVLYKSGHVTEELARQTVTLQANNEFSVVFDTTGYTKGVYKAEVPAISGYSYLGDSVTLRVIEIIDRSDEIVFKAFTSQEMDGTLDIEGTISGLENSGVQIGVTGPKGEPVFGPAYITVKSDSSFSTQVPVKEPGTYNISFTDAKGYIGTIMVMVKEKPEATTPPTVVPTTNPIVSASASASRDRPATFTVVTGGPGTIRAFTSSGIDWVIEYTDPEGKTVKVNEKGSVGNEEIIFDTTEDVVVLKVYPYSYAAEGEVLLSADGAVRVEGSAPSTPATQAGTTSTAEPSSPLPVIGVVVAVLAAVAIVVIRRKW